MFKKSTLLLFLLIVSVGKLMAQIVPHKPNWLIDLGVVYKKQRFCQAVTSGKDKIFLEYKILSNGKNDYLEFKGTEIEVLIHPKASKYKFLELHTIYLALDANGKGAIDKGKSFNLYENPEYITSKDLLPDIMYVKPIFNAYLGQTFKALGGYHPSLCDNMWFTMEKTEFKGKWIPIDISEINNKLRNKINISKDESLENLVEGKEYFLKFKTGAKNAITFKLEGNSIYFYKPDPDVYGVMTDYDKDGKFDDFQQLVYNKCNNNSVCCSFTLNHNVSQRINITLYNLVKADYGFGGKPTSVTEWKELDLTLFVNKLKKDENARLQEIARQEAEAKRLKVEAERKAEAERIEEERQEAMRKANLEARRKPNRNKALWKLGNQICCENDNGIYSGTIDQWNEDKSRVKIIIVSGPSTTFEGQKSEKGSAIWVDPSKWHLCLEEDSKKSLEEDNSKPSVSSNSSGSKRKLYNIVDYNLRKVQYDERIQETQYSISFINDRGSQPVSGSMFVQHKDYAEEYGIRFVVSGINITDYTYHYRSQSVLGYPSTPASSLDEAIRICIKKYIQEIDK